MSKTGGLGFAWLAILKTLCLTTSKIQRRFIYKSGQIMCRILFKYIPMAELLHCKQ